MYPGWQWFYLRSLSVTNQPCFLHELPCICFKHQPLSGFDSICFSKKKALYLSFPAEKAMSKRCLKLCEPYQRNWTVDGGGGQAVEGLMYSQRSILDQKNLYVSRESQGPTSISIGPKGILDPRDITRSLRCHRLLSTSWSSQHKVKVTHVASFSTMHCSAERRGKRKAWRGSLFLSPGKTGWIMIPWIIQTIGTKSTLMTQLRKNQCRGYNLVEVSDETRNVHRVLNAEEDPELLLST